MSFFFTISSPWNNDLRFIYDQKKYITFYNLFEFIFFHHNRHINTWYLKEKFSEIHCILDPKKNNCHKLYPNIEIDRYYSTNHWDVINKSFEIDLFIFFGSFSVPNTQWHRKYCQFCFGFSYNNNNNSLSQMLCTPILLLLSLSLLLFLLMILAF